MKRIVSILIIIITFSGGVKAQDLYKVSLIRASPGNLMELIDRYKEIALEKESPGTFKPLILRHSQGATWDLMIIEGIRESEGNDESIDLTNAFLPTFGKEEMSLISYHEEMIMKGPEYDLLKAKYDNSGYFHIEMFISLPGKEEALYAEREMENEYLKHLDRPENFIFTREFGSYWDLFTLGTYTDLTHYAASALIAEEDEEKAAKKAGFESATTIGAYLRSLILEHHDTLAVKVED